MDDKRSGFSLIEAVTATAISLFVLLGTISVYRMGSAWWHETAPRIEAERIARVALASIRDGYVDPTAGTDSIGSSTYKRRNGIAWAVDIPDITLNLTANDRINFRLDPDAGNVRSFYMGIEGESGERAVYYKDNSNIVYRLNATVGITGLRFEIVTDAGIGKSYIRITTTVERDIMGTRSTPYHIKVNYSDIVYLRNV